MRGLIGILPLKPEPELTYKNPVKLKRPFYLTPRKYSLKIKAPKVLSWTFCCGCEIGD